MELRRAIPHGGILMKRPNIVLIISVAMMFFAAFVPAVCAEDTVNQSVTGSPDIIQVLPIQSAFSISSEDGSTQVLKASSESGTGVRSLALKSESAYLVDRKGLDWQWMVGGSWGDGFFDIQPTNDGNFVAVGASGSWDIKDDNGNTVPGYVNKLEAYVVKINPVDGRILWHKLLGARESDGGMSIRQTADNGYIFAGSSDSVNGEFASLTHGNKDGWVVKLGPNGEKQWQVMLGGSQNEELMSIRETPNKDGYIVTGYTTSDDIPNAGTYGGNTDIYVAKLDLTGKIVWQKVIGGDKYDFASSIIPASDGGYIVAGYTESGNLPLSNSNHGYNDIFVMKLDESGNVASSKLLGGRQGEVTAFDNVIQQTPEGYIVIGQTLSSRNGDISGDTHGSGDVWVVRLDKNLNIISENLLGGSGYDDGTAIQRTNDGSYIIVGRTMSSNSGDVGQNNGDVDIWVAKLDPEGKLLWQDALGGSKYEQCTAILPTADDGFILAAFTMSGNSGNIGANHGYEDGWLAKLKPRLVVDVRDSDTQALVPNAKIVLTDVTHKEDLELITTSGRGVFTGSGTAGQYRLAKVKYSVKASADKYRYGELTDVIYAHDGQLVPLEITAIERPTIEKTFSITNNWIYSEGVEKGKTKPAGDTYYTTVRDKLKANGWTQVGPGGGPTGSENDIVGLDIVPRFFGGTSSGSSASINDATIHFHMGHGYPSYFIGENGKPFPQPGHTDGHTSIQLFDQNYNVVEFQASQIQNKWGGKNKWVVLQSCYILEDGDWGMKLGSSHGILGYTTAVDMLPGISSEFLMNSIDEKKSITASWKDASKKIIGKNPAPTHYGVDNKPDYTHDTTDTVVAVIFKNEDQYKNDHLPGLGEYIAPDGPDDGKWVRHGWSCATGNEVDL